MIILVAGAGIFVYQFGFNNKKETATLSPSITKPIEKTETEISDQPADSIKSTTENETGMTSPPVKQRQNSKTDN